MWAPLREHLPRNSFPNAYPGATPAFAPHTNFDSAGNVIGGFGVENVITDDCALHLSRAANFALRHGGPWRPRHPGELYLEQVASTTTSQVLGGTGSTGAVASGFPQNPFDTHPEKGPSAFDVTNGFSLSVAQDLHLEQRQLPSTHQPQSDTGGWELLSISSISSGSPFTVFSGIQQTGAGSNGVDRPDQIARPHLSTARTDRAGLLRPWRQQWRRLLLHSRVHVAGGTGPNQGVFGTLGRNTFRGPAYYDYDFALIKDTPFGQRASGAERVDLQFRVEFFNLFNIVNMGLPANILGSTSTTGQIIRHRHRFWRNQQDRRQLAADSVLAQTDLLATGMPGGRRQPSVRLRSDVALL